MASAGVARLGDTISHGGSITGSGTTTKADNILISRLGDAVNCAIHGAQTISSASTTVKSDNQFVARIGDSISCGATITSGSSTVIVG